MLKHVLIGDVLQTTETLHSFVDTRVTVWSLNIKTGFKWQGAHDAVTRKDYRREDESLLRYKGEHYFKHVNATLYVSEGMAVRRQGKPTRYFIKKCGVWSRVSAVDFEQREIDCIVYNTHNTTSKDTTRRYFAMYQVHVKAN